MNQRFIIIASGYNCADKVLTCIRSVSRFKHYNVKAVFISDGSTDATGSNVVREAKRYGFEYEVYTENTGAAKRRFDAIKKHSHSPDDVIIILGLDDELITNAIPFINAEYNKGKWMTYGTWKDSQGYIFDKRDELFFPEEVHEQRSYRKVKFRSTAPNTFKKFLFDQLTEQDFQIDGKWLQCTTESNMMFSFLEMCGKERIGVITTPIYFYNMRGSQMAVNRIGRQEQTRVYNEIISRPKKELLVR